MPAIDNHQGRGRGGAINRHSMMPMNTTEPRENATDRETPQRKITENSLEKLLSAVWKSFGLLNMNVRSHFDRASLARWDANRSPSSKTPRTEPATMAGTLLVPESWMMSEGKLEFQQGGRGPNTRISDIPSFGLKKSR